MVKFDSRKSLTAEEAIEIEENRGSLSKQEFNSMTIKNNLKFCKWLIESGRRTKTKELELSLELRELYLGIGIVRPDDTMKVLADKVDKFLFGKVPTDIAG